MSNILYTREHAIYQKRRAQLLLNSLAVAGGNPYIEKRLVRAPNESDISWIGRSLVSKLDSGRRDRAVYINDAGRISQKINSYLFAQPALRDGIDEDFKNDVSRTGLSVDNFWSTVSESLTTNGWVWVSADRNAPRTNSETGEPELRTLADREMDADRIYWSIYPALNVPDWSFGSDGGLNWIITSTSAYENQNPGEPPKLVQTRTLWQRDRDGATYINYVDGGNNAIAVSNQGRISSSKIPFQLVGSISGNPCWFDDVERICGQLLNMDSLHSESLMKTVFPQLVIGAAMLEGLETKLLERQGTSSGGRTIELVRELIRGLDSPLIESGEEKGITRFLMPSSSDLNSLPAEISRKRKLLFDMVGLSLFNKETRQMQTAESKAWDALDTSQTLKNRANIMETAETKLVGLSLALDSSFKSYEPVWNKTFNIPDVKADVEAIERLSKMTMTNEQRELFDTAFTRILNYLDKA